MIWPGLCRDGQPVKRSSALPGEFEIIARYFAPLASKAPGAFGLLDDAAVIAPGPRHELVVKTDAIVEGIHFLAGDPADLVGRKALRVNLSDLAAKGAVPRAYLLNLLLPENVTENWIAGFACGLERDQEEYGVYLIGGDTNATPGPLSVAVTALGEIPTGQMLRRSGAGVNDRIYVTGTIGDAALGLAILQGTLPAPRAVDAAYLTGRYQLPRPRVLLGPRLIGLASATADISDGLVADLGHICDLSGVAAIVEAPSLPLSAAADALIGTMPELLATMITGGDDYEILFTAPQAAAEPLAELARACDVPITPVGRIVAPAARPEGPVSVLGPDGRPMRLDSFGWTHF